jgi:uncharacterized lipoprotein YddW (UPF0748 family)
MKKQMIGLLFFLCLVGVIGKSGARAADRPEMRAFWADGFNAGYKTPLQVEELLQRLHDAHCNAIFAQVRKGGDAYYASHYEPWAKDDQDHFDALAYLIQKAHALNPPIAVHAWINTCAVGGNGNNPFNIVHLHPEWLALNPQGADFDGEATKIDPGNPGAADWTFRVYLDVARHYDVDGIHFDFVRYGGKEWGYNPVSVARFQQRYGDRTDIKRLPDSDLPDPDDATWKQWRRDQVTNMVRKVYAHAAQVHPNVVVSAAVITWGDGPHTEEEWSTKSAAMNRTMQDWRGWLQEGMIDLACPMTYFQADFHTDWQQRWSAFIKDHQYRRAATVAVGTWFNTIPQSLELMRIAREKSDRGHWPYGVLLYSYAGTNASETRGANGRRTDLTYQPEFYAMLGSPSHYAPTPPFPAEAALPPMPWKTDPKQGHLKGFVLTADLDPLDGATVTVRGRGKTYTRATDGTGFYALIGLPPGNYTVRVTAPGYQAQTGKATLSAGKVTTTPFTLGGAATPRTPSLAALQGRPANGAPVRLENLLVTLGSDTFPVNLYVLDSHGIGMRVRLAAPPPLPFQPGDIVAVNATLLPVDGEPTLDRAIVRLTDMAPMTALPAPRAVTATELAAGTFPTGVPIRLAGSVIEVNLDGFTLDVDGTRVGVPLTGLKDFGVEATRLTLTAPVAGTRVSVTGFGSMTSTPTGAPRLIRLRPAGPDAVQVLPAVSLWQNPRARTVALCLFRRPAGSAPEKQTYPQINTD